MRVLVGAFFVCYSLVMELVPDTTNVVYIDEYPELKKRVWLRRLAAERSGQMALFPDNPGQLVLFPDSEFDDGA